MYQLPMFNEDRLDVLHDLINTHSFGILISHEDGDLSANHLPFVLHPELSEKGTLRAHIAKGNSFWKKYDEGSDVMVIFQGPHHYISPGWYASKAEHGKVVPTWNYVTVHARGSLKLIDDPDWLMAQLKSLTTINEEGYDEPWKVSDAPEKYITGQMKGIIGIEIEIKSFEGKWKMSQNKNAADKTGVISGLIGDDNENSVAMAEFINSTKGD